ATRTDGGCRPAEALTPPREYRDHHRRRTLGKPSAVLRNDHEGLPHPVGVTAYHKTDAALGGPEPSLEGKRRLGGHGGSPPGKTGLDKHAARGGRRVGAKGFGLLA